MKGMPLRASSAGVTSIVVRLAMSRKSFAEPFGFRNYLIPHGFHAIASRLN